MGTLRHDKKGIQKGGDLIFLKRKKPNQWLIIYL